MSQVAEMPVQRPEWSIAQSEELYRVALWGDPYFFINAQGHVAVRTGSGSSDAIDIASVVEEAKRRGIDFPVLIRFQDVLRAQVARLNQVEKALTQREYSGPGNVVL
ncbi:MAG: hypothetical protein OXF98_04770, partial [Rhodospirillaceae bacterium]|nr:hypothetical protein [Rhodospirillaceae bacterium]